MYKAIIIEDDPVLIMLNTFHINQYEEIELAGAFRNAKDALSYIKHHKIDLILLDYHLPGMNGKEFLLKVREVNNNIDFIIITIDNDISVLSELIRYGVIDFILKPYTKERFHQSISTFLKRADMAGKSIYLSQEEIDSYIFPSVVMKSSSEMLAKGIQKSTYDIIFEYLKKHEGRYITIKQLEEEIKLSKVTVRRYMKILQDEGKVVIEYDYGTGGRPATRYIYRNNDSY